MHVFIGILLVVSAFVASHWAQALPFAGLANPSAMVLLLLGPMGIAMVAHPYSDWRTSLTVLRRAFRHNRTQTVLRASEDMYTIARAVRESRLEDAEVAVSNAKSEQVRRLAVHLLARMEPEALQQALSGAAFAWMAEVKAADEFLQSLARASPAFGMIGTIMGLVELFANIRDSASLGPGMAMALLATLYGLILCYCFYMPMAQRVRSYLLAGVQEQRAIERAIHLLLEGRAVHEVRSVLLEAEAMRNNGVLIAQADSGTRP